MPIQPLARTRARRRISGCKRGEGALLPGPWLLDAGGTPTDDPAVLDGVVLYDGIADSLRELAARFGLDAPGAL